ncbi:MAG: DUF2971 domain-containing protein [Pseudomonas sp.]
MNALYHYTDLNALLSIIRNKKLWLTGTNNLNDFRELNWATSLLSEKLFELSQKHGDEKTNMVWQIFHHTIGVPYICSLTSDPDLLSQWRGYGDNAAGVAIGFKLSALPMKRPFPLLSMIKDDSVSLHEVIYDKATQENLISAILEPIFSKPELDGQIHAAISLACTQLCGLAAMLKNPAFHEEREWRIIHRPMIMGREGSNESEVMYSISPPQQRVARNKLITYFEYDLRPDQEGQVFQEIVLGPKCEVSDYDLSIFLTQNGIAELPVRRSAASYR